MEEMNKQTGELVEQSMSQLALSRDPAVVLKEARNAAKVLKTVLDAKPRKVILNSKTKEQYLEFEDWQLLGKFYGITARVVSTSPVQIGSAVGFEAYAEAIHIESGKRISSADAMCLNDEDKWRARSKFDWKTVDGQRVKEKVGEEGVPMFQLRSMAQTRACAKSLRNALAWVVVLAGGNYRTIPAEEMDNLAHEETKTNQAAEDPDLRFMKAKFKKPCCVCGAAMEIGSPIVYNHKLKTACHEACHKATQSAPSEASEQKQAEPADPKDAFAEQGD